MTRSRDITVFIDPPSHHYERDRLFDPESRHNRDNMLAPYRHVQTTLQSQGMAVHTGDFLVRGEALGALNIYFSLGNLRDLRQLARIPNTILSAFFVMECPIVEPGLYRALKEIQTHFNRVFSWSDAESLRPFVTGPLQCERFYWPIPYNAVHPELWGQTDRKFLVMVNSNKRPRLEWRELYTERLRAIDFFSRLGEIDLYGMGWDEPSVRTGRTRAPYTFRQLHRWFLKRWSQVRPDPLLTSARRVYRGPVVSKAETLSRYTFALCFENMILNGWLTEKIFDCFFVGTVPIYLGSPTVQAHIPEECFIDMRRFENYSDLREHLKSLTQRDIQQYRENAKLFLQSPQFQPFTQQTFSDLFCRVIGEDSGLGLLQVPGTA